MGTPHHNLKAVLEYLGLTNLAVSKATGIDPSSVSRMVNGRRRLLAASPQMEALADYLLAQSRRVADMDWLGERFRAAGLPTDVSTVYRFRQNLIMWLATDGDKLRRNLGAFFPGDMAGGAPPVAGQPALEAGPSHGDVKTGVVEIVLALRPALAAPPIATVIRNGDFVAEMQSSFETAARYAQPILNIYGDDYSRNILELLHREFCTPGALDVVKDSINPLYMPPKAYDRYLKTRGRSGEEYAWRSSEFARFKSGMASALQTGSAYREILSLSRLNDISLRGSCRRRGCTSWSGATWTWTPGDARIFWKATSTIWKTSRASAWPLWTICPCCIKAAAGT